MRPCFGLGNVDGGRGRRRAARSAYCACANRTPAGAGVIVRVDPRFDALVPAGAAIEKVVEGFVFLEGPAWLSGESRLLYSDLRGNAIYQWTAADGVSDYAKPFFTGDGTGLRGVGPNGVALDAQGRLLVCVYGSRSVVRLEKDGSRTTLADRFEGKRLEQPQRSRRRA